MNYLIGSSSRCLRIAATTLCFLVIVTPAVDSFAAGKIGLYGIYMVPQNMDARQFSRPGWGFGIHVVAPVPQIANLLAFNVGFEYVNLLSESTTQYSEITPGIVLPTVQSTQQEFYRLVVGGDAGPHGRGFLRPHVGANVGLYFYRNSITLTISDDFDEESQISKTLDSDLEIALGYDVTLGLDLNLNKVSVDGGVRYVKSFGVPQQLESAQVDIYPDYFQIYFGLGLGFGLFSGSD